MYTRQYTLEIIAENLAKKVFLNPFQMLQPIYALSRKNVNELIPEIAALYLPHGMRMLGNRAVKAGQLLFESLLYYLALEAPENEMSLQMIMTCLAAGDKAENSDLDRLFKLLADKDKCHNIAIKKYNDFKNTTSCPDLIAYILLQQFKPLFTDNADSIFMFVKNPEIDILNIARGICFNCTKKLEYIEPEDNAIIYLLASILFYAYFHLGGDKEITFYLSDLPTYKKYYDSMERISRYALEDLAASYYNKSMELDPNIKENFFALYNDILSFFGEFTEEMRPDPMHSKKEDRRIKVFEITDTHSTTIKFELLDEIQIDEKKYVVLSLLNEPKLKNGTKNGRIYECCQNNATGQKALKSLESKNELNFVINRLSTRGY